MNLSFLKLNNGETFIVGSDKVTSIYKLNEDKDKVVLVHFQTQDYIVVPYHSVLYFQELIER